MAKRIWLAFALTVFAALLAAPAASAHGKKFCSATASRAFDACHNSRQDDFLTAVAVCENLADPNSRSQCISDAKDARGEAAQLCRDQLDARRAVCKQLGEARYVDDLDPNGFDTDFAHLTHPNPYFPIAIGDRWEYQSNQANGTETDVVEMLDATKAISGVTCIVGHDVVK
ncbi:MAG: hypothetical protein ACHQ6T_12785, partial [Myxococcota bacterium]